MKQGYDIKDKTVETACVTVSKVTSLYYYIEPRDLMFGCSTRLKIHSFDGALIVYHITEEEALHALLNTKKEKAWAAQKDIEIIIQAIGAKTK